MDTIHFAEGFILGLSLLVAIGPKDNFVIKNSLSGGNALMLIAICALGDVLLITLGVAGLGAAIAANRFLMMPAMVLSIAYLLWFAAHAGHSAWVGPAHLLLDDAGASPSLPRSKLVSGALFHSLLTPFAWLDTVLVIGSLSTAHHDAAKLAFVGGTMLASFAWFGVLTLGTRLAAPLFRNRRAWQGLDLVATLSMLFVAGQLLAEYPWQAT